MNTLEHFQDREKDIQSFDDLWNQSSPWVLAYTGFSGNGKSTLLDWLIANRCVPQGIPYSIIGLGEKAAVPEQALNLILEGAAIARIIPSESLREYRARRRTALEDLNRRQISLSQTQTMQSSESGQQTMSADLSNALREIRNQSDQLIAEAWLDCMAAIPSNQPVVLFLDNYELFQDSASLEDLNYFWTTLERANNHLPELRIVVASRESLRHKNDIHVLQNGLTGSSLANLNNEDSNNLLRSLGVTDSDFRKAVYHNLAQGHPLITRMAGEAWLEMPDGISSDQVPYLVKLEQAVEWVHGRIIERLGGSLKQAVRWAALLRWFQADSLSSMLEDSLTDDDFLSLIRYSFIVRPKAAPDFWACHDLVRRVQSNFLRHARPQEFKSFNERAMAYYIQHEKPYDALYHHFLVDPQEAFEIWSDMEAQASFQFDLPTWGVLIDIGLSPEIELPDKMKANIFFRAALRCSYRSEWIESEAYLYQAQELFQTVGSRAGEANTLKAIGEVQQFRKEMDHALDSYSQALELFQALGDKLGEASSLKAIGDVQQFRKEMDEALESYGQALELFLAVRARGGEANTLKAIGDVQQFRKEMDEALETYGQALELYQAVGAQAGEANTLLSIGDVQQFRKETDEALESYYQALELYQAIGIRVGEANTLLSIGEAQRFRNEMDKALNSYDHALELFQAVRDRLGEANTLLYIGYVQQFRKHMDEALDSYNQALELYQAVRDRLGEANTLKAIGDVQQYRKETDEALENYGQALEMYQAVGERVGEANTLLSIGEVQQFRKEMDEALESYNMALELYQAVGSRVGEANTLLSIGDVQQFRKETEEALESYGQALELFQAVGDKLGEANALKAIGEVQQFRKEMDEALESYNMALELFQAVGDKLGEANTLKAIGQHYLMDENEATQHRGTEYLQAALDIFTQVGNVLGQANIATFLAKWLSSRGRYSQALPFAEQSYRLALEIAPNHPALSRLVG